MAGNIKKTGQDAVTKWARNLKGAGETIREGVERVTEAPGLAAAAAQDKMLAGVTAAVNSGKWGRRVAAVPLQEWKEKMIAKGIQRIPAGVDGSMAKAQDAFSQIISHADSVLDVVLPMPSVTLEDNIQRAVRFMRGMAELEVQR